MAVTVPEKFAPVNEITPDVSEMPSNVSKSPSPENSPENKVAVTVPEKFPPVEEITPDVTEIPSNFFAKRAIGTWPIKSVPKFT